MGCLEVGNSEVLVASFSNLKIPQVGHDQSPMQKNEGMPRIIQSTPSKCKKEKIFTIVTLFLFLIAFYWSGICQNE
jgi:hypothetical protein